jgi:hypothetical protein
MNIDILNKYKKDLTNCNPIENYFINWLGVKTDSRIFPYRDNLSGQVFPDLPTGPLGDGVYGGAAEYFSVLTALNNSLDKKSVTAVELGAGWGPWISAFGVVAKNIGFNEIILRGVEADLTKCKFMRDHLAFNGLGECNTRIIHGAAWHSDTIVHFPEIDAYYEQGAAASGANSSEDYRGNQMKMKSIPAYSLRSICENIPIIDYMHWDVQGAEFDIAATSIDYINTRVRYLFIGTHSRLLEGKLIELFFINKWKLHHHAPSAFSYDLNKPSLEGMGVCDGELFFENPYLSNEM